MNSDRVREVALELGFGSVGIGPSIPQRPDVHQAWIEAGCHGEMAWMESHRDVAGDPNLVLPGAVRAICILDRYPGFDSEDVPPRFGRIARYARGKDYHVHTMKRLRKLGERLSSAFPDGSFRACVDTVPLMERDLASGAGLGRIGKNTLLIEPRKGSWAFLGVLLTTIPFEMDTPLKEDPCGTCTRCIEACPTGAIKPWKVDARRCISYLTLEHRSPIPPELHEGMGNWLAGCDICQEVCPHNHPTPARVNSSHSEAFKPKRQGFDLLEVLGWSEDDRRAAFQGSALKRVKYDALQRNALILLTNQVCQGDSEAEPILRAQLEAIEQSTTASEVLQETARVCRMRLE